MEIKIFRDIRYQFEHLPAYTPKVTGFNSMRKRKACVEVRAVGSFNRWIFPTMDEAVAHCEKQSNEMSWHDHYDMVEYQKSLDTLAQSA